MKGIGKMEGFQGKDCIYGRMGADMKGIGLMAKEWAKVLLR